MAFDAEGYRKAALNAGVPSQLVEQTIAEKTGVKGWLTSGKSGLQGLASAAGNILNLPSYALGGIANRFQQATGNQYGQGERRGLGIVEGIQNKRPIMSELPETLNIDPTSALGMALGFAGELLTPDPFGMGLDALRLARGVDTAKDVGLFARGVRGTGSKLTDTAEMLPLRGLGRNKTTERLLSQLDKAGMSSDEFMDTFNLWNRNADDAQEAIRGVNRARKAAVRGAGDVDTVKVVQAFNEEIQRLAPAAQQSRSAAAQLERVAEARDSFLRSIESNGAVPLQTPLGVVEQSKQFVSQDIPQSYFNLGSAQTGRGRGAELVRRRLKNIVDESTGQTRKLGAQESALINYQNLLKTRELADKGNMNLPFTKLIGAGAGGAIGGIPGAVAGYGAQQFFNSPFGIKTQTKTLRGAGRALTSPRTIKAADKAAKAASKIGRTGFRVSQQPTLETSKRRQVQQPDPLREKEELPSYYNSTPSNFNIKLFRR